MSDQLPSRRGVVAIAPQRPERMMMKSREAARRPTFVLHVPGGETYFGGWSCILVEGGSAVKREEMGIRGGRWHFIMANGLASTFSRGNGPTLAP